MCPELHIAVFVEIENALLMPVSRQLLDEAFYLAAGRSAVVSALVLGPVSDAAREELLKWPLGDILHLPAEGLLYTDVSCRLFLSGVCQLDPDIVLIGSTPQGRVLASYTAAKLHTGITADCTELELTPEGKLLQSRPAFGGNLMAQILINRRPQLAIVRPGALSPPPVSAGTAARWQTLEEMGLQSAISVQHVAPARVSTGLSNARAIVAVGRGLRNRDDLEMVKELADLLGAEIAGSRAVIDMGWLPPEQQIGLSGQSVSPDWLLTLGISGSIQFCSGIRNVKRLIAVNQNPDAPILRIAHIPVCSDLYRIVPKLIEAAQASS